MGVFEHFNYKFQVQLSRQMQYNRPFCVVSMIELPRGGYVLQPDIPQYSFVNRLISAP